MSDFDKDPSYDEFPGFATETPLDTPTTIIVPSEPASLVTQMKRECFGDTYNLKALLTETRRACIVTRTLSFDFNNGSVSSSPDGFVLSLSYIIVDEQTEILNGSPTLNPVPSSSILSNAKAELSQDSLEEGVPVSEQSYTIRVNYINPNVQYTIGVTNMANERTPVVTVLVTQQAITFYDAEELLNLRTVYSSEGWTDVPLINILSTTEIYYGRNLGQVGFDLLNSKDCCLSKNGDVKYLNNITQLSDYPCLTKVVAGQGKTLVEKMFYLWNKYKPSILKLTFLGLIITYGMIRYYLWYLAKTACFDITILYQENNKKFEDAINATVYEQYNQVFNETPIKGYGEYYRYSKTQEVAP
jgi:hypothetical protein